MSKQATPPHILVIEDDPDTRANLQDILELDDYRVEAVGTIAEAMRLRDWVQVTAIILDRKLPDGAAEDLLPRLKQVAPRAAVIIATGFADVPSAIAALRLGAADYILKPINAEELRSRLGHLVEQMRTEEQVRALTTFPTESPAPILRVDFDGTLEYANAASTPLLELWNCRAGQRLPETAWGLLQNTLKSGVNQEFEMECGDRLFSLLVVPIAGAGHINIYGRDVTERRAAESARARKQSRAGKGARRAAHEK